MGKPEDKAGKKAACPDKERQGKELILCLEKGVRPLKDVSQLIDCIYEKEEADCESIITDCRVCDFRFPVLATISNLYFKQRIMFQIL